MKKILTYSMLIAATVFWGLSFIWTTQLINLGIPLFLFSFSRMFIAGVTMLILCKAIGKLQKIQRRDLPIFLLCSFLHPFLYFTCETFGLKATGSPTLCSIVSSLSPICVMIVALIVFKTRVGWKGFLGAALTFLGIIFMCVGKGEVSSQYWWGFILLFGSLFASVSYNTVVQKTSSRYNAWTITTYQFLFGSFFLFPFVFTDPQGLAGFRLLGSWEALAPLLSLAFLCSCAAFVFYVNSIKEIGMTRAVVFNSITPIVSAIVSFGMGLEAFTWLKTAGVAIILVGVYLAQKQ